MNRNNERGFSFIEVIIALGLLATVLVSISSLFVTGRHQVRAGRSTSEALALARSILEEMESWGFSQSYSQFGLDGSAPSYTIDTRTNTYAGKWQDVLEGALLESWAEIRLASVTTGGSTPVLSAANGVRIVVTVHWSENQRERRVDLGTVKL